MKKQKIGIIAIATLLLIVVIIVLFRIKEEENNKEFVVQTTTYEDIETAEDKTKNESAERVEIETKNEAVDENKTNIDMEKEKPEKEVKKEEPEKKPGEGMIIECWGDSLTVGFNGDGVTYPDVLAELSGAQVRNYGVSGETSLEIAARQGGIPMQVNNITIPASGSLVLGDLYGSGVNSVYGGMMRPMARGGESSVNPCTIAGVTGRLDWTGTDYRDLSGTFMFTRESGGEEVAITAPVNIVTNAMADQSEDIIVIFIGENGGWESNQDLANQIQAMIAYSACKGKYVVCGLTTGTAMERAGLEQFMELTFGDKYLNLRKYLVEKGVEDAVISPTPQDTENIESGIVPGSLRSDDIHGNSSYYRLVGGQLYEKILELGYFNR